MRIVLIPFLLLLLAGCGVVGATATVVGTVGSAAVSATSTAVDVVTYPIRD